MIWSVVGQMIANGSVAMVNFCGRGSAGSGMERGRPWLEEGLQKF